MEEGPFPYAGEVAALCTAVCWSCTSLSFQGAGQRIGSLCVNFLRLVIALLFFAAYGWVVRRQPLPVDATASTWGWLSLSAACGYLFGDLCLFRAFVVIGARLGMLCMALWPPLAALLSLVLFGEQLAALQWIGIAVTVGGIAWVVLERRPAAGGEPSRRVPLSGVLLGLGGALGQAVGYVLIRRGLGEYDAFAASQIRALAGAVGFAVLFSCIGWWPRVWAGLRHPTGLGLTAIGAFFGPFLGVSLSVVAQEYTEVGVAATIISLTPVLVIPPAILCFRERVSLRALAGALLAVGGVALLWLSP
jgi:drug/metabolite transporter (DMT)-like permease